MSKKEETKYEEVDTRELARFRKRINNAAKAEDVRIPDMRYLEPHKAHRHYDLHITEQTGLTIIDTFHFRDIEAIREAVEYTQKLLGTYEQQDSKTTTEDTPDVGSVIETPEEDMVHDTPPGAA